MIYAIGDIHGCYDEFQQMLKLIDFNSEFDMMYFVGDYIDRGKDSYKMLKLVDEFSNSHCCRFIRGNHEQEFITNVDLLSSIDSEFSDYEICEKLHEKSEYFDMYGTIRAMIGDKKTPMRMTLARWANILRKMPLYYRFRYRNENFIIVHAGYNASLKGEAFENFALYAREEAYTEGGCPKTTIISGHTPTTVEGEFPYNEGDVFVYEKPEMNCTIYNLDCGSCFRDKDKRAKLACIRLEDKKIFYI